MTTPDQLENFTRRVPDGDNLVRDVCDTCGFIGYQNPKVVVGSVVTADDGRFLLCRRAIEPRAGFWTIPAGYLELNETPEDGARREAMEEACATIEIDRLLAIYAITRLSQIQIIYRATLADPKFAAGPESIEVDLFGWDAVPWDDVAFPSVRWALEQFRQAGGRTDFAPFTNPERA